MNVETYMQDLKSGIVEDHLPIVHFVAGRVAARLPANIELNDLISWGTIGLLDAIKKYDPARENSFKTYAEFRIRGAIFDELRKNDLVPRSARDLLKIMERVNAEFMLEFGIRPSRRQLAEKLKVSEKRIHSVQLAENRVVLHEDDPFSPADKKAFLKKTTDYTADATEKLEAKEKLEQFVAGHAPIDRACFYLHYIWGLTQSEIAECFDVSESRINQRIMSVTRGIREKKSA